MMRTRHGWFLGATLMASLLVPARDASAWIAVGRPFGWGARCFRCGVAAPALGGFAAGALLGAAAEAAAHRDVEPPIYAPPSFGTAVSVLPPDCQQMNVNSQVYYQCGATWYRPYFGGGGAYYEVVPVP